MAALDYLKDPQEIYARSFAMVRAETNFSHLPASLEPVAVRMIHACGMTGIAGDLRFDPHIVETARDALQAGAPILADCEAVAAAITRKVLCTLNDPRTPALARQHKTTRSAAAVRLWQTKGAIIVIGNAPTALFALLELLDAGAERPAAIIATPVGFVGAAESKQELFRNSRGIPYLTLLGRRGGSAMAAAAFNAIARGISP